MNIVVRTYEGNTIVRTDTSLERNNNDLFVPDYISAFEYTPVLFARICKPGKCIGREFATRYYDGIGYGILLWASDLLDGSEQGFAQACCVGHTSFLPFPLYNPVTLGRTSNEFKLYKDGKEIYSYNQGTADMIADALAIASERALVRTGDILAVELQPRKEFSSRQAGEAAVSSTYCDNETLQFKIVW